jgi:hypothetical protein
MPRFAIFQSRVWRGIPSFTAAPLGPEARGHLGLEIAVGGGEYPYISRNRLAAPDTLEFTSLEHSQ